MERTLNRKSVRAMRPLTPLVFAGSLVMLTAGALAAPAQVSADGQRLHEANCTGCHGSSVYTRKSRAVHSLNELKQQLDSCGHASGKQLSADEKQQIVRYLNEQFYKFR